VWVRESADSGSTWLPPVRLAADPASFATSISVTSDGASRAHFAVWSEDIAGGGSRIFLSQKTFGVGSWSTPVQVSTNTGSTDAWDPSIAATPAYLFVAYTRVPASGDPYTGFIRIFNRSTATWAPATNLGSGDVVRLAATSSRVYAVWSNGVVRVRRGAIGSGAASPSISWSTSSLGSGQDPIIAVSGSRGVVVYDKGRSVLTRRTTNSGASWLPATKVLDARTNASNRYFPVDAAMSGSKIVATAEFDHEVGEETGNPPGHTLRITSSNGGASWAISPPVYGRRGDHREVAYTTNPSTGLKTIAELWDNSSSGTNTWKVLFHRSR
jgi:hypothetical protein